MSNVFSMTHREAARGDARDGWVLGFWECRDKIRRDQGAGKYPLAVERGELIV